MDNFIEHNLLSFRNKLLNISPNAELGRVEIAVAADMCMKVLFQEGNLTKSVLIKPMHDY